MSIIYNALQKTQQDRAKETLAPVASRRSSTTIGWICAGIVVFTAIGVIQFYPKHTSVSAPKIAAAVKPVQPAVTQTEFNSDTFKSRHVVNGVYLSNQEKIALINNKFVHPGETIDGMEVVSIEANRVILRNADNALILPVDQSQSF